MLYVKAVTYSRYGGPDGLVYGECPDPKTGPVSVLVRFAPRRLIR